jgi:signal transduction histidine kinase
VTDDGPGIAPELLPRVFEPHFSTRSAGTGLGLAIVRRLVESWGGAVTAESEPGRGTTIRLRLTAAGRRGVDAHDEPASEPG